MASISMEDAVNSLRLALGPGKVTGDCLILENPIYVTQDISISRFDTSEIHAAVESYNEANSDNPAHLKWQNSCEYLLANNNANRELSSLSIREMEILSSTDGNDLTYSAGAASLAFSIGALNAIRLSGSKDWHGLLGNISRRLRSRRFIGPYDYTSALSLEKILAEARFLLTVKIASNSARADFDSIADAFLFELAYNFDTSYRIASNFDHLTASARSRTRGRTAEGDMDAPRMTYNSDLIHHYQLAVSADSPMLKYLSYYHIAEHFFEKIFNDDLVEQVRKKIADPSFSLRRSKDIQAMIRLVANTQRKIRDEGGVDEQRALFLVLDKYVEVSRLVGDINEHDPSLVQYYKSTAPPFAENTLVDLNSERDEEVKKALAKRIYMTRNALVHAKDGTRPKYYPFTDDVELSREVPLMRYCSEQVVISNGKVL